MRSTWIAVGIVLAAFLAGIATGARGDGGPDRLSIPLASHHIDAAREFEEVNPGLIVTWDGEPLDVSIGAFRNSYGGASVAAVLSHPIAEWEDGELAVMAGVALYPVDGRTFAVSWGDVVPIAGLHLRHGPAFVQLVPSDGVWTDAAVSFGLIVDLAR